MQLGKGTFIKGQDKDLPGWLLATMNRSENVEPGLVIKIIHNWNDGKNEIFDFWPSFRKVLHFKDSKRGQ